MEVILRVMILFVHTVNLKPFLQLHRDGYEISGIIGICLIFLPALVWFLWSIFESMTKNEFSLSKSLKFSALMLVLSPLIDT